jgi:hypothetical protein
MRSTRYLGPATVFALTLGLAAAPALRAQDDATPVKHGRKYKAPPETAHIEVTVVKGFNKKPIMNAAVVFHPIDDQGKDDGNLEVKSGPDGKATIDIIPIGSTVRVQVIADGFATYAAEFKLDTNLRQMTVAMVRPEAQVSAYKDNEGKAADTAPGIVAPIRPKKSAAPSPESPAPSTPPAAAAPASSTPQ